MLAPARGTATVTNAVVTMPARDAPCPKTVLVTFTVKVTRPGTLYFRRVSSDGSRDNTVQTVSFDRIGDFDLAAKLPSPISWNFAKPFRGWVGIHFDANPAGDSNVEPSGRTALVDLACPAFVAGQQRQGGLALSNIAPASSAAMRGKLSSHSQFSGLQAVSRMEVKGSSSTYAPRLTTLSPYFSSQVRPKAAGSGPGSVTIPWLSGAPPAGSFSYLEVEQTNIAQQRADCFGPHAPTGAEFGCHLKWGDDATVKIGHPGEAGFTERYNNVSFRWTSSQAGVVGGHWQVSRHPFTTDAQHWQDGEVAGLVDSGPVTEAFADAQGFHYFKIDFSTSANESLIHSLTAMHPVAVHAAAAANAGKPSAAGKPVARGAVGFQPIAGANTRAGQQGGLQWPQGLKLSPVRWSLLELDRTYYVRIVPLRAGGKAGVPTLPVEVTVTRPHVCQPPPPQKDNYVVVRPPSARVVSFYMTSFVPTWIQTDQNGRLRSRAHYVTIAPPPGCDTHATPTRTPTPTLHGFGLGSFGSLGISPCEIFQNVYHGQVGYHYFIDPPPEPGLFDTLWNIIKAVFKGFESVVNSVSSAWSKLEAFVVQVVADAVQVISFNTIKCGDSDVCKGVLEVALKTAMAASGIPPTLPNASELENLSVDYLAKVGAEEIGAGGALDTAEAIYGSLPPQAKQEIKDGASQAAGAVATAFAGNTAAAAAQGAGTWFIPDPLYYQSHPAYLMVQVYNPNSGPTDPVYLHYGDSAFLYKQKDPAYVPALKPGESTSIPIVLEERFDGVYSEAEHCTRDSYTSICDEVCIPCYWNLWIFAAENASQPPNSGDTFWVSLSAKVEGRDLYLGTSLSGKPLNSQEMGPPYDDYGTKCAMSKANVYLKYPDGWKYAIASLKQDLRSLMWLNYTFSEGDRGFMRTKQ